MSSLIENLNGEVENITELELLENKINRINKIREIIRKGLKELEIMRINKIKELHEIEIEIKSLEIKIIIERIKDKLEEKKC